MSGNFDALVAAALAVLVVMVVAWLISLPLGNAGVVDVAWGVAFISVAWISAVTGDGHPARSDLLTAMVSVWGARMALNRWWRSRGTGEPHRYREMRRLAGEDFAASSLITVFLLRGFLVWVVSLPVQLAMVADSPDLGLLAVIGVGVWGVGFFLGSVGDAQLARFVSESENEGRALDSGLRRFSQHPEQLGDFCVAWGIFLVAAESSDARFGVVGPLVMSIILVRRSGMTFLPRQSRTVS